VGGLIEPRRGAHIVPYSVRSGTEQACRLRIIARYRLDSGESFSDIGTGNPGKKSDDVQKSRI
jgi:hypothetical protein